MTVTGTPTQANLAEALDSANPENPLWRKKEGLGPTAYRVWLWLLRYPEVPYSVEGLRKACRLSHWEAADKAVKALEEHGLAVREGDRWVIGTADAESVVQDFPEAIAAAEKMRERIDRKRETFANYTSGRDATPAVSDTGGNVELCTGCGEVVDGDCFQCGIAQPAPEPLSVQVWSAPANLSPEPIPEPVKEIVGIFHLEPEECEHGPRKRVGNPPSTNGGYWATVVLVLDMCALAGQPGTKHLCPPINVWTGTPYSRIVPDFPFDLPRRAADNGYSLTAPPEDGPVPILWPWGRPGEPRRRPTLEE